MAWKSLLLFVLFMAVAVGETQHEDQVDERERVLRQKAEVRGSDLACKARDRSERRPRLEFWVTTGLAQEHVGSLAPFGK